jgi:hypothetical protein
MDVTCLARATGKRKPSRGYRFFAGTSRDYVQQQIDAAFKGAKYLDGYTTKWIDGHTRTLDGDERFAKQRLVTFGMHN